VDVTANIPVGSTNVLIEAYDNCQVGAGNSTAYLSAGVFTNMNFQYPGNITVIIPDD
jgi:hypothetical protein